jgi:hypothetical protein
VGKKVRGFAPEPHWGQRVQGRALALSPAIPPTI